MHTIRLRGPWECLIDGKTPRSVRLPDDNLRDLAAEARESCVLQRHFNRPTGLENEEVYLSIQFAPVTAAVSLNGLTLGETSGNEAPVRFAIRNCLKEHNVVGIHVQDVIAWANAESSVCAVSLEIEASSRETP